MNTNDSAKTILCFGDSNTWGSVPRTDDRYPRSIRWPGALQNLLGAEYEVISEGLCGRTLVAAEENKPHRVGITHLQALLESADPVDVLVIMLGTNDVKTTFGLDAKGIAQHLEQVIGFVQGEKPDLAHVPRIIVVCPPPVIVPSDGNLDLRMSRAGDIFKELPTLFKAVAEKYGCDFINAGDSISCSTIDGYHLDASGHQVLAALLAKEVVRLS